MTLLRVVSLRDSAVAAYMPPQFVVSTGGYLRAIGDEIAKGGDSNALAAHPEDYIAYELGHFDDDTGRFILHDDPVQLARVIDLKR